MSIFLLGILGGMGPAATNYLYHLIIKHTPALKDQDHIPTLIYSNTLIPDRTECILQGKHEEIITILSNAANLLENMGANMILMPCNTAHYYIEKIQERVNVPILDMLRITADYLHDKITSQKGTIEDVKVGLLATSGTIKTEIYQKRFMNKKININTPKEQDQAEVMKIIYDIKKTGPKNDLTKRIDKIIGNLRGNKGIKWIILGCTEIPLLFQENSDIEINFLIDPMEVLAKHVINDVKGKFV